MKRIKAVLFVLSFVLISNVIIVAGETTYTAIDKNEMLTSVNRVVDVLEDVQPLLKKFLQHQIDVELISKLDLLDRNIAFLENEKQRISREMHELEISIKLSGVELRYLEKEIAMNNIAETDIPLEVRKNLAKLQLVESGRAAELNALSERKDKIESTLALRLIERDALQPK